MTILSCPLNNCGTLKGLRPEHGTLINIGHKYRLLSYEGEPVSRTVCAFIRQKKLFITFITAGELYYGAEKGNWGIAKRQWLERVIEKFILIPCDVQTCSIYDILVAERFKNGRPIGSNDAWIAACAVRHKVSLVTHNKKDFLGITGLEIISACPD